MNNSTFPDVIRDILLKNLGQDGLDIFTKSNIIQYLVKKTASANKGAKSRGSFANLYAIYVIVEDYIKKGYLEHGDYRKYEGAIYSDLIGRVRETPFGEKLQNHALNNRLNEEYLGDFPADEIGPIIRDTTTKRYWLNENLIRFRFHKNRINLAPSIIK